MKNITTTSAKQTFNFAKKFALKLKGGEVICLIGNLGAGKTIFVKGLAACLGIKKNITSPTFVLMRVYPIKSRLLGGAQSVFNRVNKIRNLKSPLRQSFSEASEIRNLVHIDAYRLKSAKDISAIGAEEYFGRSGTVTVIEWADKVKKILPKKAIFVKIIDREDNKRIINIKKYGF